VRTFHRRLPERSPWAGLFIRLPWGSGSYTTPCAATACSIGTCGAVCEPAGISGRLSLSKRLLVKAGVSPGLLGGLARLVLGRLGLADRLARNAAMAGARVAAKHARELAPVRTGALRASSSRLAHGLAAERAEGGARRIEAVLFEFVELGTALAVQHMGSHGTTDDCPKAASLGKCLPSISQATRRCSC